jgi:Tol biopolymer transport system component
MKPYLQISSCISPALALALLTALVLVPNDVRSENEGPLAAQVRQITTFEGEDREPSISHGGRYLAFLRDEHGNRQNSLIVIDLQTGNERVLTPGVFVTAPAVWASDDSRMFVSFKEPDGLQRLGWVDLESGALDELEVNGYSGAGDLIMPALSQDESTIAFSYRKSNTDDFDLVVAPVSGASGQVVSPSPYRDLWPRFTASGEGLYFFSRRATEGESDDLYFVRLEDQKLTRLTDAPGHDFTPAPSPDSRQIAFISNRSGQPRLYVYSLLSGQSSSVELGIDRVGHPSWTSDSQRLFVTGRSDGGSGDVYEVFLKND